MSNTTGEYASFAGARTGHHQQWATVVEYRVTLIGIEALQQFVYGNGTPTRSGSGVVVEVDARRRLPRGGGHERCAASEVEQRALITDWWGLRRHGSATLSVWVRQSGSTRRYCAAVSNIVRVDQHAVVPWRNGGGTSLELFRDGGPADFRWRITIVTMEVDSQFSVFPGYERWQMLLSGAGMGLHGVGRADSAGQVLQFPGELAPGCSLIDGPVTEFNLFVRRGEGWGDVSLVDITDEADVVAVAVVALSEGMSFDGESVARYETVVADDDAVIRVTGRGTAVVVNLLR